MTQSADIYNLDLFGKWIILISQGLRFSSVSQLPEPSSLSGSSLSLSKSPRLPTELSTDHSMKAGVGMNHLSFQKINDAVPSELLLYILL